MLEVIDGLPDNVVGVRATGEVDDDYEDVLDPAIAEARTRHDKIRLLKALGPEFTGYDHEAMWEDTKLGFKTFISYERIAIVTDATWVRRSIKAVGWLIPGQVKVFRVHALIEATSWVQS